MQGAWELIVSVEVRVLPWVGGVDGLGWSIDIEVIDVCGKFDEWREK